jgi:hypothetical protein
LVPENPFVVQLPLGTGQFTLDELLLTTGEEIALVKQQAPQNLQRRAAGVNLALEARSGSLE